MMLATLLILVSLCSALPSWAQTYDTLTMVRPVATGSAGTGLHANNRIYRAHPGIQYEIHADAIGGNWPYTYALSGEPTGMTISAGPCTDIGPTGCTAGTITWTNPQTTCSTCTAGVTAPITVTVTDKNGTQVSGTWSITVTTTGFYFINADSGNNANAGTLAAPWQTLDKARTTAGANSIVIFRGATAAYTLGSPASDHGCQGDRYRFFQATEPTIFIGYPGETAVIDFQSTGGASVPCIFMQSDNIWIDNLEIKNIGSIGFDFAPSNRYGPVVRKLNAHDLKDGENGQNSSFIRTVSNYNSPSYHYTVQNSYFDRVQGDGNVEDGDGGSALDDGCGLKVYSSRDALFEHNHFSGSAFNEAMMALKSEVPKYTVRGNIGASDVTTFIGGNMDKNIGISTQGDIYHNLCLGSGGGASSGRGCLTIGWSLPTHPILQTQVWRNTFIGEVVIANLQTQDGPYYFNDNVILNSVAASGSCPANYRCDTVTDYSRLVDNADNLKGANDGSIANATTGILINRALVGTVGFELGSSGGLRFSPSFLRRVSLEVEP